MAVIAFNEWIPDAADFGNPGSPVVQNALPGLNSYKPLNSLVVATNAIDARPRGAIEGIDKSENVYQYVGNETKLYSLTGSTWGDVSAAPYTTAAGERWEFARFKEKIIATNFTDNPQAITFGGSNFADLTTALRFRHVAVVRDFVVAGYTFDGTDGIVRDRVRWSAINDETDWTASATTLSDFRDLKSGGIQAVVGGEYGVIITENSTFRMTFIGAPKVFQIDEVVPGVGALMPGGVVSLGDTVFYPSEHGFVALRGGSQETFIGVGRVDEFFKNDLDTDYLDRVSSVADPSSGKVFWSYPGAGNAGGSPNKIIVYDRVLDKWGYAEVEVELLWRSGGTAATLEQLDTLGLGGDLITNGTFAADSDWVKGTGWTIAAGVATHAAGTASNLAQLSIGLDPGTYYRVTFDVTGRTAGSVTPALGGIPGTAITADATGITEQFLNAAGLNFEFVASSDFDGSVDNVTVNRVNDLDSMTISLDSSQYKGSSPLLAGFDPAFKNGNFTGTPYTGTFTTREVELHEGHRTALQGFIPLIDGGEVTARVGYRRRQSDDLQYTGSLTLRDSGVFKKRLNRRYHRFELTVTGNWRDAIGVQVDKKLAPRGHRRG